MLKALCCRHRRALTKTLRVMNLTAIILLSACLTASAVGNSQPITIQATNAPLEKVLLEIKKQSGYHLFYKDEWMQKTKLVDIQAVNKSVEEVLRICFKNQPFTFEIVDKTIVIKEKIADPNKQTTIVNEPPPPITVRGRVVNEHGEGVIASVMVKGTTNGTTTNSDGHFTLDNVDENAILVITGINIEGIIELKVNGKANVGNIVTKTKVAAGEDITIKAGYYDVKKRVATGNISRVDAKEIKVQPVSNPLAALQGRVTGMEIIQQTGVPGGNFKVRIRGINSIGNGNDPLYIIDGVPFTSSAMSFPQNAFDLFINGTSPLNGINPSDIESIEILKDADATAIYGSRGANGVVLITTKKGMQGKMKVDFNLRVGSGNPAGKLELMETPQYLAMRREALNNAGIPINPISAPELLVWDTTRNVDWQKELLRNTANTTDAQISLSGGDRYSQYVFGLGYRKETTVFPGENSDRRFSSHVSLTNRSKNEKLTTSLAVKYAVNMSDLIKSDLTSLAMTLPPNAPPLYKDNGDLNWGTELNSNTWVFPYLNHPLSYLKTDYETTTKNLLVSAVPVYSILKNLDVRVNLGYSDVTANTLTTTPLSSLSPQAVAVSQNSTVFSTSSFANWTIEPQVNWKPKLGKGKLNILVGTSFLEQVQQGVAQSARGFADENLMKNIGAAATIATSTNYYSQYRYNALFGRINYELAKRYILNLTGRRDGSSRFGAGKQFANFGAVGFAWLLSEEKFIKDDLHFLSFGKLRISYGLTGNDQLSNYEYLDTYRSLGTYQGSVTLYPVRLANPEFAWETNQKFEAGLDLSFFKNRIESSVSFYRNRSSNQLVGFALPPTTGFASVQGNLPAVVQNKGWEIEVHTRNIEGSKWNWSSSFNVTIPRNKLIAFPNLSASPTYANTLVVGEPLNIVMKYNYLGVDPQTGMYKFEDINQDGFINSLDLQVPLFVGQTLYGGIRNSFQFNGITFDVLFSFSKQTTQDFLNVYAATPGGGLSNQPAIVSNPWRSAGDIATYQVFSQATNVQQAYDNHRSSSGSHSDASYIRLKNLNLSYQIPVRFIQRLKMQQAQFFLQAQNLLTITNYKGLDPESTFHVLPPLRMITAGFSISL